MRTYIGIALVAMCATACREETRLVSNQGTTPSEQRADELLARLGSDAYWLSAAHHSGYQPVREYVRTSPEVLWLVQHRSLAVPRILQRVDRDMEANAKDMAIAAYSVVLELAGAKEGLPWMIDYLASLPADAGERLGVPGEPANYVIEAVNALADLRVFEPGKAPTGEQLDEFFARRSELLARAEAALR